MLAVSRDHVTTPAGRRRADDLAAALPKRAWQQVSYADGAKGRRFYDWALVATSRPEISLLVARPSELAFYLCHTVSGDGRAPLTGGRRPSRADSG